MPDFSEVAIVGAGPAGIATAIQLRRSGVDFSIFEERQIGGLLLNAHLIENYPGFPLGISGPELVERLGRQLERWEIQPISDRVEQAEYRDGSFFISAGNLKLTSHMLVVASGTVAEQISDPLIPEHIQDHVYYEVHPLKNLRGRHVVIVGAGDAAFDYAMSLAEHNHITILCRGNDSSCLSLLSQRAKKTSNIEIQQQIRIQAIEQNQGRFTFHVIEEGKSQERRVVADFILVAIGRRPALNYLAPSISNMKENLVRDGYLYFVGDVKNQLYRQTGICVGDGIKAAMQINERIRARQA